MLTRLLAAPHLIPLATGVIECVRGDNGIDTLLRRIGVLMLPLLRVNEVIGEMR